MKNKIVTHFYVKEQRKDSQGEAPIYLRITVNGDRAEISADRKVKTENWDRAAERVAGRTEAARITNSAIVTILGKVEKYYSALDSRDERISAIQIINEIKGKGMNQTTIIQTYNDYIKKMDELISIEYEPNTIKRYKSSLSGLKNFMKTILGKTDLRLYELNFNFIESSS